MFSTQSFISNRQLTHFALYVLLIFAGHFLAFKVVHVPAQLEMVVLFSLLIFYPIIRNPQIGVILLFSVMPFIPYLRRLYYLQYARPAADPLIVLGDIIIAFTLVALFFEFRQRKTDTEYGTRIVQVTLMYVAYALFRTFVFNIAPPSEAIMKFRQYGPGVFLFVIGTIVAYNKRMIQFIVTLTVCIGCISVLYGLNQLMFGYSKAEQIWFSSISFTTLFIKGLARPFSFFQSPAAFADYMQLSIIGLIILISTIKTAHSRLFLFLLLPLFFYGSLITSVRSNWIGIIVTLMLWSIFVYLKSNKARVLAIVVILLLFTFSQVLDLNPGTAISSIATISSSKINDQYLNLLVRERANAIVNPFEEHSLVSRLLLWKFIIDVSFEPYMGFVGRGIGALNADSIYFMYLAELGYPGFIFIVSLTLIFIWRGFTLIDKSEGYIHGFAIGITIFNIVFAIINITGTHIHSFPGDAYFWFFNGVILKFEAIVRKSGERISYENITYH